ncbi:hypothetical protein H1P_150038 [Hyella patelloides LEGE 07179]|uniref:Uncharacterized protein n=1 Tax=Hyella patelloides LEGE 07179 TaxID=945734 RepID=A0A563VLZ3_9CYAN|nr:hypothetical protein H1P_150038 [Hyella patelloides LEGE 07179]
MMIYYLVVKYYKGFLKGDYDLVKLYTMLFSKLFLIASCLVSPKEETKFNSGQVAE